MIESLSESKSHSAILSNWRSSILLTLEYEVLSLFLSNKKSAECLSWPTVVSNFVSSAKTELVVELVSPKVLLAVISSDDLPTFLMASSDDLPKFLMELSCDELTNLLEDISNNLDNWAN